MDALCFGYNAGVPDTAKAAWGARLIVTQDGTADLVHDRTDCVGPADARKKLLDYLSESVGNLPFDNLRDMLRSGEVDTRSNEQHTLFSNDVLRVIGSPQGSAGYFYVAAFFDPAEREPEAEPDPVKEFLGRYNAWLATIPRDEQGDVPEAELRRFDEGRTDWGQDALELLESIGQA